VPIKSREQFVNKGSSVEGSILLLGCSRIGPIPLAKDEYALTYKIKAIAKRSHKDRIYQKNNA